MHQGFSLVLRPLLLFKLTDQFNLFESQEEGMGWKKQSREGERGREGKSDGEREGMGGRASSCRTWLHCTVPALSPAPTPDSSFLLMSTLERQGESES